MLVFFLIGLIDNVPFFYLIIFFSGENIVNHIISAKHKLAWCYLQCCVIVASDSLIFMPLIEGSNQMDYLLLDFR
jgi:hypothetical protein